MSMKRTRLSSGETVNGQRADAGDGVLGRELPLAERGAVQRVEAAAVAVGLEHGEHRRRQRRQQFAVDDRAGVGAEQLDVERVVPARLVQRPDQLVGTLRGCGEPRFALLGLGQPRAVGHHDATACRVALAGISIGTVRSTSSPR